MIEPKQEVIVNESHELLSKDEQDKLFEVLRNQWKERFRDLLGGAPPGLPPLREVNHTIQLIDEKVRYNHQFPKCPDAFKDQFMEKLQ